MTVFDIFPKYLIKRTTKNQSSKPDVDMGDILELVGCKMFSRK